MNVNNPCEQQNPVEAVMFEHAIEATASILGSKKERGKRKQTLASQVAQYAVANHVDVGAVPAKGGADQHQCEMLVAD